MRSFVNLPRSPKLTPIDSVELRTIRIPLVSPFETAFGLAAVKEALVIILKKGPVTAYGECVAGTGRWYSDETIASASYIISNILIPLLLRSNIETPSEFLRAASSVRGNNMAVACVEMALWDLIGKLEGKSVAKLLGGAKEEIDAGVSVGIQPSIDAMLKQVSSYIGDGYRRIKIKIKPGLDIEPTKAVRAKFQETPLQVDANSAYTLDQSEVFKKMDDLNLLLIEQPLGKDDMFGHAKLQKQLSTPLCLDESIRTPAEARQALDVDACRVINIKPGRVRGLERSKEIHDLCRSRNIPVWCGGMLETGIGRAFNVALASLPGFTLPGDISASRRYFARDIITSEFELTKNGTMRVPTDAGIGVQVDQDRLNSCTINRQILTSK